MKPATVIAVAVAGIGAVYLASHGALASVLPSLDGLGLDPSSALARNPAGLTPGQQASLAAIAKNAPGNAMVVPPPGAAVALAGAIDSAAVAGAGVLLSLGLSGAALGAATAGVGLAVAFFTYEWLKQKQSMATNRARDAWTAQFIPLHAALQLTPLTAAQTKGSGPGDLEMAEVIFFFDHDSGQRLWHAVQNTQNEAQFQVAARAVEVFLAGYGVPVTGI